MVSGGKLLKEKKLVTEGMLADGWETNLGLATDQSGKLKSGVLVTRSRLLRVITHGGAIISATTVVTSPSRVRVFRRMTVSTAFLLSIFS